MSLMREAAKLGWARISPARTATIQSQTRKRMHSPRSPCGNAMIVPVQRRKIASESNALGDGDSNGKRAGNFCPVLTNRQAAQPRLHAFPLGPVGASFFPV